MPVPIPVPVYVPVPMHMYSQSVPVPTTLPVPVSHAGSAGAGMAGRSLHSVPRTWVWGTPSGGCVHRAGEGATDVASALLTRLSCRSSVEKGGFLEPQGSELKRVEFRAEPRFNPSHVLRTPF